MTRPGGIAVFFAVRAEAGPFRRDLPPGVQVVITGMGATHARRAAEDHLYRARPRLVLTCGFAGGLHPGVPRSTVLFDADPHSPLAGVLERAGAVPAQFHCATRVAVTVADKRAVRAATGADAVEMESGVVREVCRAAGVASATLRVVSDAADEDLPVDFNRLMNAQQDLDPVRLAGYLLRQPAAIAGLFRLQRHCAAAARALARVLRSALADPDLLAGP